MIDPLRTVDNALYTSAAAFDREEDRILARCWSFVCHRSEVALPGQFLTTTIAGSPVIVTRDEAGALRAFHNTCRHRGSAIVTEDSGQCRQFRCPYHWWTYALSGALVSVPHDEGVYEYEGSGFSRERLGLRPVRVEEVTGLVFVCLDDATPPLREYLGSIVELLRVPFGSVPLEIMALDTCELKANWKNYAENARDGYHVPFVHPLLRKGSPPQAAELLENGHAVQWLARGGSVDPSALEILLKSPLPGTEESRGYVLNIYPNLLITYMGRSVVTIHSMIPENECHTRLHTRALGLAGEPVEARENRRRAYDLWITQVDRGEDAPILENQQRGFGRRARGVSMSLINRGGDDAAALRGNDNRLRHFWKSWRRDMGVPYNSLDPAWNERVERDWRSAPVDGLNISS